jgi:hypothetical protein
MPFFEFIYTLMLGRGGLAWVGSGWLSCKSSDKDKNDDDDDWCQKFDVEYPNRFEPKSGISEGDFLQGIFNSPDVTNKNADDQSTHSQNNVAEKQVHVFHEIPLSEDIHSAMRQARREAEEKAEKTY